MGTGWKYVKQTEIVQNVVQCETFVLAVLETLSNITEELEDRKSYREGPQKS
jgi:hypothetical protein